MIKGNLLMQKTAVFLGILVMLTFLNPVFVDAAGRNEAASGDLQDVFNELDQSEMEQVKIQKREQVTEQMKKQMTEEEKNLLADFWDHLDIFSPASLQIPPPSLRKQVAYIMAGDISSLQTSLLELARLYCTISGNNDICGVNKYGLRPFSQQLIDWIFSKSHLLLQVAGYKDSNIRIERRATAAMLSDVLENPTVGALIWIGHGQPGKIIDVTRDDLTGVISEAPVRRWARDFLEKKGIYKSLPNYPRSSGMFKAMATIENHAHFGLNYFYSHSCFTMKDKSLSIAMLADGGRYEGYTMPKLAYVGSLTPVVSGNVNQDLPDVHSLVVVPDVKGIDKTVAQNMLQGFDVDIIEDREDKDAAGQVYAQHPAEGTILDKYRSKMHVKLNVYKSDTDGSETQDDDSQGDENSGNDKPSLVGFDPMFLIHVTRTYTSYGPVDKDVYFLHPAKPVDGKINDADSGAGTFTHEGEDKGGPFKSNYELCPVLKSLGASNAILPDNRTIDCSDPRWKAQ